MIDFLCACGMEKPWNDKLPSAGIYGMGTGQVATNKLAELGCAGERDLLNTRDYWIPQSKT